jgi:hypothetical protein
MVMPCLMVLIKRSAIPLHWGHWGAVGWCWIP